MSQQIFLKYAEIGVYSLPSIKRSNVIIGAVVDEVSSSLFAMVPTKEQGLIRSSSQQAKAKKCICVAVSKHQTSHFAMVVIIKCRYGGLAIDVTIINFCY